MSSIDEQFVSYIVKSLVSNPDDVVITRTIDEKGVLLELTVNPDDLGRVIGRKGSTAQSIRTLLRALGAKNEARYNLKITDNGIEKTPGEHAKNDSWKSDATEESDKISVGEDKISQTRKELEELDDLDL